MILCCFYSPPNSKQKTVLNDHIQLEYNRLKKEHPNALALIVGDKNDLNLKRIIGINPKFKKPSTIPPIKPDKEGLGSPSDHLGVLVQPTDNWSAPNKKIKVIRYRTFPESGMREFGQLLMKEEWKSLEEEMTPTEMVDNFEKVSGDMIEKNFPMREMKVTQEDKPWINAKLKELKRKRQRIYRKHGRSQKYLQVKETFDMEKKKAIKVYKEKIEEEVRDGKRSNCYKTLRRLDPLYENN